MFSNRYVSYILLTIKHLFPNVFPVTFRRTRFERWRIFFVYKFHLCTNLETMKRYFFSRKFEINSYKLQKYQFK